MASLRQLGYWIGCIGTRLLFVYLAYIASYKYLKIMGALALIPAIGFFVIYFGGFRKTGIEVAPGGGRIWWSSIRPIHGLLYLSFAVLAFSKLHMYAWIPLAIDVFIGIVAKLVHMQLKS